MNKLIHLHGVVGMLALIAAGCTVGPDYHRPEPYMPADWTQPTTSPATQTSTATTRPADVARWWTTLQDPVLSRLVDEAMESNLDLRQATARIRQTRAARGIAGAGGWPNANASADYRRSSGGTNGAGNSARDLYQAGFDASWELDVFGGVRRSVEAADADLQASIEDRRDVMISLVAEVARNYIDLRSAQQEMVVARRNLTTQQRSLDLTRARVGAGFNSPLDVANAEAQVAITKAQIPMLEASVRQTIYGLSVLLARQPAALLPELTADAPIPATPPDVPVGLPSELLRRRPDIRRAEAQVHAASARIGVATADLFPSFSLTGNAGISADSMSGLGNWGNRFWSIGPAINWTIFDAGRIRWNIEAQNAAQEQVLLAYEKTVLAALADVESALVAYAQEQQRRLSLVDAVTANRKAVDLSTQLYAQGQTDFLNVLSAQGSLLVSEDLLTRSDQAVATNLVALYKALGGGWEVPERR